MEFYNNAPPEKNGIRQSMTVNKKGKLLLILLAMFIIIGYVPFAIAGTGFLFAGLKNMHKNAAVKKMCDSVVQGTVTDYNEYSGSSSGNSTAPVFSYEYNGIEYKYEGKFFSDKKRYSIGQNVDIRIYSDDPEIAYVPSYREQYTVTLTIMIVGMVMSAPFIFIIIIAIILIKNKIKLKKQMQEGIEYES